LSVGGFIARLLCWYLIGVVLGIVTARVSRRWSRKNRYKYLHQIMKSGGCED